jgi:hypothetical protein
MIFWKSCCVESLVILSKRARGCKVEVVLSFFCSFVFSFFRAFVRAHRVRPQQGLCSQQGHTFSRQLKTQFIRMESGRTECALYKLSIRIALWAYSVRPYNPISVQETTPGEWEAPDSSVRQESVAEDEQKREHPDQERHFPEFSCYRF